MVLLAYSLTRCFVGQLGLQVYGIPTTERVGDIGKNRLVWVETTTTDMGTMRWYGKPTDEQMSSGTREGYGTQECKQRCTVCDQWNNIAPITSVVIG